MAKNKKMMDREKYAQKLFEKDIIRSRHLAEPGPNDIVMILDNLKGNFNVGKIFRSAEAFGVKEILLVGIDYFDPIPAKGCVRKVKSKSFESFDECYKYITEEGYEVLALDSNAKGYMHTSPFPRKSAFILGHEEFGMSFKLDKYPNIKTMKIKHFGKVESLNVAVAASLSMYEYVRQHEL